MNIRYFKPQLLFENQFYLLAFIMLSILGFVAGILLSAWSAFLDSGVDVSTICAIPAYGYLLAVNAIPIIIVIGLLFFSLSAFCYPFVFLYSACRGFVGMTFCTAFGNGAWLIRFFLWFSSYATAVLIWWLLFRNFQTRTSLRKDSCVSLVIILAITVFDFRIVAPFLSSIFL